jgi:gentisate 1,2-dioxygenase
MVGADVPAPAHSPKYHYTGAATRRLLAALPAGPDGARTMRYTNPATGDAVMSALDCYAVRLPKGKATRPKRATCNMICLVVSGSGRSTVAEHTFDWSQNDVFSIPHWSWASHTAKDGDADLFIVSDKVAFERLDLLREELQ